MKPNIKLFIIGILFVGQIPFYAQNSQAQDSTLNNLVHPEGYTTCNIGKLGSVKKIGKGKQTMILVAGFGFGANEYTDLVKNYKGRFTIYLVTPAGFQGTPAPVMPDANSKYSDMSWTYGVVTGILNLIEKEKLVKPIIVSHFVTSTQVAFKLGTDHSDKIAKIIIIGGAPYRYYPTPLDRQWKNMDWKKEFILTPEKRSAVTETYWAQFWFKTVTKKTWDDNMWTPMDYCKDSTKGKQLFKISAKVPVHVMIRYIIEWGAYDADEKYMNIKVPTLILIPDFKGILANSQDTSACSNPAAKVYLNYFHKDVWQKAEKSGNTNLQFKRVYDTRLFMWIDNPSQTYQSIDQFLER